MRSDRRNDLALLMSVPPPRPEYFGRHVHSSQPPTKSHAGLSHTDVKTRALIQQPQERIQKKKKVRKHNHNKQKGNRRRRRKHINHKKEHKKKRKKISTTRKNRRRRKKERTEEKKERRKIKERN